MVTKTPMEASSAKVELSQWGVRVPGGRLLRRRCRGRGWACSCARICIGAALGSGRTLARCNWANAGQRLRRLGHRSVRHTGLLRLGRSRAQIQTGTKKRCQRNCSRTELH